MIPLDVKERLVQTQIRSSMSQEISILETLTS
jgi:hypothetical protein